MANPRKFSEKIALHNQKQAEETAAFEAIMRDVSEATRGPPSGACGKPAPLHLSPGNLGTYRGGSLPNVNQIGNNAIDLQNALHNLNEMKHGRESLVDRLHRERVRQLPPHHARQQRPFQIDKRADCSPYGITYLSPPPDTSWRRSNSDSALHTSAMSQPGDLGVHSPTTPPSHRRVAQLSGDNVLKTTDSSQLWDPKKQALTNRPKSCEVPGINIYPSPEQESGIHISIANNTGSLPDLTNLHFPSPLTTPLDAEDQNYQQQGPGALNLSPTGHGSAISASQQTSPSFRRRHPEGGPSPLVIHSGSPAQIRHNLPNQNSSMTQYRNSQSDNSCHSPTSPLSQPSYSPSQSPGLPPSTHTSSSAFGDPYWQQQSQQQTTALQHQFEQFNMVHSENHSNHQIPNGSVNLPLYGGQMNLHLSQDAMAGLANEHEVQQQQTRYYPQPPSPQQHSPQQGSPQPPQSPQAQESPASQMQASPHEHQHPQLTPQSSNKIPDIILTGGSEGSWVPILQGQSNQDPGYGADDSSQRQNFNIAKDIGNAMAGMHDVFDDADLFTSDEALKVGLDPLDLDGLQMLTDPNLVTDPATEDQFRLDRLT